MKFNLTQEFIDNGVRSSPCDCPVALTLRANGFPQARVGPWSVFQTEPEIKLMAKMPYELVSWIAAFDSFQPVAPIEFELGLTA